jgi:hypothetical protein
MSEKVTTLWDLETGHFVRIPGLLRRWEIERVLEPGADICIEEAGSGSDGETLYAVFRREIPTGESEPGRR